MIINFKIAATLVSQASPSYKEFFLVGGAGLRDYASAVQLYAYIKCLPAVLRIRHIVMIDISNSETP